MLDSVMEKSLLLANKAENVKKMVKKGLKLREKDKF